MGKSASEVRADIEDTRRDMSVTIDAIADRTVPSRVISRREGDVEGSFGRERVWAGRDGRHAGDRAHGVPAGPGRGGIGPRHRPARASRHTPTGGLAEEGNQSPRGSRLRWGMLLASLIRHEAEQRVAGQCSSRNSLSDE